MKFCITRKAQGSFLLTFIKYEEGPYDIIIRRPLMKPEKDSCSIYLNKNKIFTLTKKYLPNVAGSPEGFETCPEETLKSLYENILKYKISLQERCKINSEDNIFVESILAKIKSIELFLYRFTLENNLNI